MIKRITATVLLLAVFCAANARNMKAFADSIRKAYHIPELGYAVVSADSILDMQVLGFKKVNTSLAATLDDKFRIGSNTKAATGYIAALLVKQGKIAWNTRFFDLFPELKVRSRQVYHHLTLLDLLSFRSTLYPYTYTYPEPVKGQFTGNEEEQRYQFARWFFRQPPVVTNNPINFSNLNYVAAGLMLEKVSGRSYKQLVKELGDRINTDFYFGQPNTLDSLQPWGHDAQLKPEPPADNYKLNWLLPAGNITMTLPGYVKFIQMQLKGFKGKSDLLSAKETNFLHFGRPGFAVGWAWENDEHTEPYSHGKGNPGTFLSAVYVYKAKDRAYILFSNAQTDDADEAFDILYGEMKKRYGR
jgi:CubicO group peptidase (beta-lactamase class C family)